MVRVLPMDRYDSLLPVRDDWLLLLVVSYRSQYLYLQSKVRADGIWRFKHVPKLSIRTTKPYYCCVLLAIFCVALIDILTREEMDTYGICMPLLCASLWNVSARLVGFDGALRELFWQRIYICVVAAAKLLFARRLISRWWDNKHPQPEPCPDWSMVALDSDDRIDIVVIRFRHRDPAVA